MMTDITKEEAERLFNQASKAVKDDDSEKLSSLFSQETPDEEEQVDSNDGTTENDEESHDDESTQDDTLSSDDDSTEDQDSGEGQEDDPLATLKAEIAALKKAQQAASSQLGRVSSIQSRLAKYDKQL